MISIESIDYFNSSTGWKAVGRRMEASTNASTPLCRISWQAQILDRGPWMKCIEV